MLWYLVVPPFIVVISFGALLWLLSRRAGDEEVSRNLSLAKAETLSESHSRSLSRKAFWLKLVEKTASRFKTATLRIHNFFQHGLEHVRKRRSEIDAIRRHIERADEQGDAESPESSPNHGKKPEEKRRLRLSFRSRKEDMDGGSAGTGSDVSEPASSAEEGVRQAASVPSDTEGSVSRPVLRQEVVRPEPRSRSEKDPREVELLSRIVENPRDAAAYEELGDWYFAEGGMEDAKECYRQALKLHPTNRAVKIKIRKLEKFFEGRGK